jgi:hypothetical protein
MKKLLFPAYILLIILSSNFMLVHAKDSKVPYKAEISLLPNKQMPTPAIFINMGSPVVPIDRDFMGNEGAHGGNDIAFQFASATQNAIDYISGTQSPKFNDLKCILLTSFFNKIKIYVSQEPLFIDNGSIRQKSVIISIPEENTIYINEKDWNSITDENTKNALAMHELLIFVGLEKTGDYTYSEYYLRDKNNLCKDISCFVEKKYFCKLIESTGLNNITKTQKGLGTLNSGKLGIEYLRLEDKNSKIEVDIFLFETLINKDIALTVYQTGKYITELNLTLDQKEKLPGIISQKWYDFYDNSKTWEVICNRL